MVSWLRSGAPAPDTDAPPRKTSHTDHTVSRYGKTTHGAYRPGSVILKAGCLSISRSLPRRSSTSMGA
jgi:hypothetical protein